jgi:hypothetical protein
MRTMIRSSCATTLLFVLSIAAALPSGVTAQANKGPRSITPDDYYSFEFISDPQLSPDAKLVALRGHES